MSRVRIGLLWMLTLCLPACGPRDPQALALEELVARGYTLSVPEYHRAAAAGDTAALALFVDCGIAVDVPLVESGRSVTALRAAVKGGHSDAAAWLARTGADWARADNQPEEPLLLLAVRGDSEVITRQLLAQTGRQPMACEPLLIEAAQQGRVGLIEALLDHAPILRRGGALRCAAAGGHLAAADLLLQRGAPVNETEAEDGRSALMAAAEGGHKAVVGLLLDAGAARFLTDSQRRLAVDLARAGGHEEIVQDLWRPLSRSEREAGVPAAPREAPPPGWETASAPAILPAAPLDPDQPRVLLPLRYAIAGHHSGLSRPPPPRQRTELRAVRAAQLPFQLRELSEQEAVFEWLGSGGKPIHVRAGEPVGQSGWRLAQIRGEGGDGRPEWAGRMAVIEPEGGGAGLALVPGLAARHGPLCAVLHIAGTDEFYEGHAGDVFRFTESPEPLLLRAIHPGMVEFEDSAGVFEVELQAGP